MPLNSFAMFNLATPSTDCATLSQRRAVVRRGVVRGSPNPKHFGLASRLRKALKHSGLTRRALARKAGVSDPIVGYIETNQRLPTVGNIARLASALGVSAAYLAYGLGDAHTDGTAATCDGMGVRLQSVRVELEVTKAELGRLAGLTAPSIRQIENGGQSGVEVIEALAQALGISPAWLAFNQGPRELPKRRRSPAAQLTSGSA